MSIALDNNRMEQVSGGFLRRSNLPPCNLSSILDPGDRTVVRVVVEQDRENGPSDPCSSSSSSIGMNSDDEKDDHKEDKDEVESQLKNTPFDSAVDALEQALPIRRGISKFYSGKSKSFASLADAACSSIKDLTKPENAYTRKRKNLLAYNLLCDKGRTAVLKSSGIGGGIAKRSTGASRSTLALAVSMSNCEDPIDENGPSPETNGRSNSRSPSVSPPESPLPLPPWRSFSLADLQQCGVTGSAVKSNLAPPLFGKRTKHDEVS